MRVRGMQHANGETRGRHLRALVVPDRSSCYDHKHDNLIQLVHTSIRRKQMDYKRMHSWLSVLFPRYANGTLQVIHFRIFSPDYQTRVAGGVSTCPDGVMVPHLALSQPAHLTFFAHPRSGMTGEISIHTIGDKVRFLTNGAASYDFATANPF